MFHKTTHCDVRNCVGLHDEGERRTVPTRLKGGQPRSNMPTELREALTLATRRLTTAGILDAAVDAELLAAHVLGRSRGELQVSLMTGATITDAEATAFAQAIARREAREPLQHITGLAPFRHMELAVGPGVFVPRPETEIVAQFAIDALSATMSPQPIAVDLGTGSGTLALAMATEVPHARVYATERSPEAHAWAAKNIERLMADNVELRLGDFEGAFHDLDGTVSVIASNPPYVPSDAIPRDPEVRLFDPPAALYSGEDGLDAIRAISLIGMRLGHSGATLVLEHGEWQGEAIRDILASGGWLSAATHPDLTHRDRATTAIRP